MLEDPIKQWRVKQADWNARTKTTASGEHITEVSETTWNKGNELYPEFTALITMLKLISNE